MDDEAHCFLAPRRYVRPRRELRRFDPDRQEIHLCKRCGRNGRGLRRRCCTNPTRHRASFTQAIVHKDLATRPTTTSAPIRCCQNPARASSLRNVKISRGLPGHNFEDGEAVRSIETHRVTRECWRKWSGAGSATLRKVACRSSSRLAVTRGVRSLRAQITMGNHRKRMSGAAAT